MTVFREFAPAKVNLTLEVLGKRPDGYHELKSLVAFADVGDWVTLDTSRPVGVTTSGPFAATIAGANLIETTLRLIGEAHPGFLLGSVHLEKNLPVAAGIGGGSADAAAVIRAVQKANPDLAADIDWMGLGTRIGADVPVCIESRLSWVTGLGEKVAPLMGSQIGGIAAVVANPLVSVPADKTAQVFRNLRAPAMSVGNMALHAPTNVEDRAALKLAVEGGTNHLEAAARRVVPELGHVLECLAQLPKRMLARMSGGGPTCFALFETADDAQTAALRLREAKPAWWVQAATLS